MTDVEIQSHVDEVDAIREKVKTSFLESFMSWELTAEEKKLLRENPTLIEHIENRLREHTFKNDFRTVFMLKAAASLLKYRAGIYEAFIIGMRFK